MMLKGKNILYSTVVVVVVVEIEALILVVVEIVALIVVVVVEVAVVVVVVVVLWSHVGNNGDWGLTAFYGDYGSQRWYP